jgi:hypothetical protein
MAAGADGILYESVRHSPDDARHCLNENCNCQPVSPSKRALFVCRGCIDYRWLSANECGIDHRKGRKEAYIFLKQFALEQMRPPVRMAALSDERLGEDDSSAVATHTGHLNHCVKTVKRVTKGRFDDIRQMAVFYGHNGSEDKGKADPPTERWPYR